MSNLSNTQSQVLPHTHDESEITGLSTDLQGKQDKLVAGSNISIAADGKTISATDTKYEAGANVQISAQNVISATDTTYSNATTSAAGLMSAADKEKLDGISPGAGVQTVTGVKGDSESSYRTGNINITKANIGLGNVDNTSDANKPVSTAMQTALNLKQDISSMPTDLGDFTNNAGYIKNTVNDLTNYYKKTETYTQTEINNLINSFGGFQVVSTLPTSDIKTNIIYLLGPIGTGADKYEEWIYTTTWVKIGETSVDLTNYVTTNTAQTISGTKTFSAEPVLPAKTAAAGANSTKPATEYQVNLKQDKLTTQTAYTSKGSATKVPQITTNTLGQVTGITEVTITQPDISGKANTSDVLTKTNTTSYTPSADYHPATKKYVDDNAGTEYNAGEGIEIGTIQDYSAMRGPAPSGFHVPLSTEWQALCGILTTTFSMASNATTMGTYLKMPMAGTRRYSNANVENVGSSGDYWSSTTYSYSNSYGLYFNSSNVNPQYYFYHATGFSIRCFKNSPVVPTSSWTTLYQGTGSAGIFWNSIEGLISVSGDGTTWYTIMDKNLGATTVFNQGDTETDANCGYFFQWGNNYGFPHSGTVTTSSTQVDASNYGPGNYYSSSTFITVNPRDSPSNDDLRGGETGVVTINDAITNTGVLSVNGQTGNVTIQTGGNYTAGNGIDITNDEIGLDGTYSNYSAMQGPCPDGFHVPTKDEWTTLLGCNSVSGNNGLYNFFNYLKIVGGNIVPSADTQTSPGEYGIWLADTYASDSTKGNSYKIGNYSYGFFGTNKAVAKPIRPFKDIPVEIDNNWTLIHEYTSYTLYHNSTLGLITIITNSTGKAYITIADKNVGATSLNGVGNNFQWGNNYGFISTPSTTYTDKVDTSSYLPSTYSSNRFINVMGDWSVTPNNNLRGGVTGVVSGNLVLGDKLYKIVTSTTAPASGTASNIITFVIS